ncbi:MAG: AAA family ATPase [Deltaproteobacteria bacterium]|nr:AAA family ATPase [Deltaproteobacteria bacterium]
MLDELFRLSRNFIKISNREYERYFLKTSPLENRFSIIVGQRGVGKTTAIIQYLLSSYSDINTKKAIYIQADHFLTRKYALYEIAEQFYRLGGELICLDEIHKYPDWSLELKSIHDTFSGLKIIASGSSALEVHKGTHDLSRRAVVYRMFGMSFREYIELTLGIELGCCNLEKIVIEHEQIANKIITTIEERGSRILALFSDYLSHGYYPYFSEYRDVKLFHITLEQNVHTTLESDLIAIYPALTGNSIKKIKQLVSVIASSVPFTPDLRKLKTTLHIGDERTLKTYLKYLEDAGIILTLSKGSRSLGGMEKPEKIYLNNPNLIYALTESLQPEVGSIRETFFLNMVKTTNRISIPPKGDFLVKGKLLFEVGGKNKSFSQIKNIDHSYLALDNMETGFGNKIPLWLFGFLY